MIDKTTKFSVWIEAEEWEKGELNPLDDNSDVIVALEDGSSWAATFFTYQNIQSLREKFAKSGKCLAGKYFWATDMILIDEISGEAIDQVIRWLAAGSPHRRFAVSVDTYSP